jgi:hypothetical protein
VDVYNGKCPAMQPIQVPLDFTLDVEEMQLPLVLEAGRRPEPQLFPSREKLSEPC